MGLELTFDESSKLFEAFYELVRAEQRVVREVVLVKR